MEKLYYELAKLPNQKFDTTIGDNNFEFRLRTFRSIIYLDVSINGELIQAGVRGVGNQSLFNVEVNRAAGGVFMFECLSDDMPNYNDFDGVTCRFCLVRS